MSDEARVRPGCLQFYLCTQMHCTQRLVSLKIRTTDAAPTKLTGPGLARALRELVTEKGLEGRVQVRETSCMRGCLIGPRLNVVSEEGFKDAVRYLYLRPRDGTCAAFPGRRLSVWKHYLIVM
jgi:predicted metal-binding protein